jgi:hypothetical protein
MARHVATVCSGTLALSALVAWWLLSCPLCPIAHAVGDRRAPQVEVTTPEPAQVQAWWEDLGSEDVDKALAAGARIAACGDTALALLGDQIQRLLLDKAQVRKLVVQLDDESYDVREKASAQLVVLGPPAAPLLRAALNHQPSPEQRWRLEAILAQFPASFMASPQSRRQYRLTWALEAMDTPKARTLLALHTTQPEAAASQPAHPVTIDDEHLPLTAQKEAIAAERAIWRYQGQYDGGRALGNADYYHAVLAGREIIEKYAHSSYATMMIVPLADLYAYGGQHAHQLRLLGWGAREYAGTPREPEYYYAIGLNYFEGYANHALALNYFDRAMEAIQRVAGAGQTKTRSVEQLEEMIQTQRATIRKQAAARAEADKTPWKDGPKGLQYRVREDTKGPFHNLMLCLLVDMQNPGQGDFNLPVNQPLQVRVDGSACVRKAKGAPVRWLGPQVQAYDLSVLLEQSWHREDTGDLLRLTPGKHKIELVYEFSAVDPTNTEKVILTTDAIEITVPGKD